MDKEAREKLTRFLMGEIGEPLLKIIKELGYRKLPKDKPPLLSDVQIIEAAKPFHGNQNQPKIGFDRDLAVAEAQRESDIKWYEEDNKRGGEDNEITGKEAQ